MSLIPSTNATRWLACGSGARKGVGMSLIPSTNATTWLACGSGARKRVGSACMPLNNAQVITTEVRPMTHPTPIHATLDDWIAHEAIPFSLDSPDAFSTAVDKVAASLGDEVELLG